MKLPPKSENTENSRYCGRYPWSCFAGACAMGSLRFSVLFMRNFLVFVDCIAHFSQKVILSYWNA